MAMEASARAVEDERRDERATASPLAPSALRRRFPGAFEPRARLYWVDVLASAAIGWTAFVACGWLDGGLAAVALVVATLALYRAALFIHELAHLRAGAIPGLETVWSVLVGSPMQVPSLMYVGSHAVHHRRSTYGTADDPEYAPIATWPPWRIVASTLLMAVFPAVLALRWGVLAPISWLVPPLRRWLIARLSTLVINEQYVRPLPTGRARWRFALGEAGAALAFWAFVAALATGAIGSEWITRWYVVAIGILVLNHLRTLVAHRYENPGESLDVRGQLADSVNLAGLPLLGALFAPVGLRYHGLHHLVPGLPYHSLGHVHRSLMAELPADAGYRETVAPGAIAALRSLFERSAARP